MVGLAKPPYGIETNMFFKYKRELERTKKSGDKKEKVIPNQAEISMEECSNKPQTAYVESYEPQANDGRFLVVK